MSIAPGRKPPAFSTGWRAGSVLQSSHFRHDGLGERLIVVVCPWR